MTQECCHLKGATKKDREGLFTRAQSDRTNGNGFKLKENRFGLDIRKKFFAVQMISPWHRLSREAVEVFKARLEQQGLEQPCLDPAHGMGVEQDGL